MKNITDYISPESCNSLPGLFLARVSKTPDDIAYRYCNKMSGQWHTTTWKEMAQTISRWRNALQQESLEPGDRVAVMLPNCPEWVAFDQAALSLGLIVVPLFANDRPANIGHILKDTESKIFLCPGIQFWEHLSPVLDQLNSLQRIITIDFCQISKDDPRITCITNWLPDSKENTSSYSPIIHETASIVYTSGTTGLPKGVMLSHRNILENSHGGLLCIDIYPGDTFLSFLPLSHMLERTAGYYLPMMAGATVAFSRSIPDLAEDLVTIKPTVIVAVPRIFERIYAGVIGKLTSKPKPLITLFHKAVETGWNSFLYQQGRGPWSMSLLLQPLLDVLVAKKVRDRLGGGLRVIITGGAPLSPEVSQFFIGLGLPLYQGYGLTETSPVISVNRPEDNRPEGVGKPLPGIEVKTGDEQELLVRGSCVMQGYWRNQQATDKTIDSNGWLHTGDKVSIEDGHIRITGRLKEIIVLSNGEKVALTDMEMAIAMDPLFEFNVVIGEGRPFLAMLGVLNRPLWEELAEQLGVSPEPESLNLPEVHSAVLARMEILLSRFPGFVFIKNVSLSLAPWTVENGLLTPTLKLKRAVIEKHMADEIQKIYDQQ
ncbi:MAG: long-chain fatty acid--CoA ligase [Desulfobulbaceae bacterium]|nr:long-chain fatty acid--CoA ligase [Desulfobulbaceae bacterium]